MIFKVQTFDDKQLAYLFNAFSRQLFTRPQEGDIYTISLHDENNSCKFLFKPEFHTRLNDEMHRAMMLGKFAASNANDKWLNLLSFVAAAHPTEFEELPADARDYSVICSRYW